MSRPEMNFVSVSSIATIDVYSYEEAWAMPVVVIDVEGGETRKTGYISLYTKLFKGSDVYLKNVRRKKIEKLLYT